MKKEKDIKYKLCVCDMDGTLLNTKGVISAENERVLKQLQEYGTELVIASGRTDLMMRPYIKQLKLKGHIICCNGAVIKHIDRDEIVYSKTIEKDVAGIAIKYCMANKLNFLVYTEDIVYSNKNNPRAKHFEELNKTLPLELRVPISYFSYEEDKFFDHKNIIKILLIEEDDELRNNYMNYFLQFSNLSVVSSAKGLLDIWASGVSKGSAVKVLSEILKVELENVVAFGDNYNDVEMLKIAGMPIAMENAVDELKQVSKYITLSNDEDGIAHAWCNVLGMDYYTN